MYFFFNFEENPCTAKNFVFWFVGFFLLVGDFFFFKVYLIRVIFNLSD